jgi:hypothetical protein
MYPNTIRALGLAAALSAFGVGLVSAQEQQKFSVAGQGGVAIPGQQLHQFVDPGFGGNLEADYHLAPRVALDAFGTFSRLNGKTLTTGTLAPSMDAATYGLGVKADLLGNETHRWLLTASAGVGASSMRTDQFASIVAGTTQFKHTYLGTMGGLQMGYHFGPRVGAFVGTDLLYTFVNKDDTAELTEFNGSTVQPFGRAWIAPITVGLQATL